MQHISLRRITVSIASHSQPLPCHVYRLKDSRESVLIGAVLSRVSARQFAEDLENRGFLPMYSAARRYRRSERGATGVFRFIFILFLLGGIGVVAGLYPQSSFARVGEMQLTMFSMDFPKIPIFVLQRTSPEYESLVVRTLRNICPKESVPSQLSGRLGGMLLYLPSGIRAPEN